MYKFPDGFLWGTSTSGPQSEGIEQGDGKGMSNWDYWFSIAPEKFHHQVGPDRTSTLKHSLLLLRASLLGKDLT